MYNSQEHEDYLRKLKIQKYSVLTAQVLILIIFFAVWEAAAAFKLIDPFIFSQPSRIAKTIVTMTANGMLVKNVGVTLGETVLGFLLGTVIGILTSIVLWWNKFLERVLNPYLVVLNSLPKTALAPIIIVWMGNNVGSIIVIALLTSVIVTILTVLTGFLEVDSQKIKLIRTFSGTKLQILTKVVLPATVPTMVNALKINIGLSFVGVIVGEFLVAQAGLGYLIVYGSQIFKMDWVMTSVLILCVLAALMYQAVAAFEKLLDN